MIEIGKDYIYRPSLYRTAHWRHLLWSNCIL